MIGSRKEVNIIATGTANLAAVAASFRRVGADASVSRDADEIERCERAVIPGVGTFAAARAALDDRIAAALVRRIEAGRPTLCICLGLHLLCESSAESPGVEGLSIIPRTIERFNHGARVPQMGWNRVCPEDGVRYVPESGFAYFANSYRLADVPSGWNVVWAEHGARFVAAAERGSVLACQFHPELSGAFGRRIIQRWLEDESC